MDFNRFEELGYKTHKIEIKLKSEDFDLLIKTNCIWMTFQYYKKYHAIKPPKGTTFYDVLTSQNNSEEYKKYRKDLGIPENEIGYPAISSRTLQRILSLEKIDRDFVIKVFIDKHFQKEYEKAYRYFFWMNTTELVKIHNRFLKNLRKLASF